MILNDYRCAEGHRFEAGVPSMESAPPPCPACGAASRKRFTAVRVGNAAGTGTSREAMPRSWEAIGHGHPDAVAHWRKRVEERERIEAKDPELAGDRRPVLAHEGIFSGRPLRAGDDVGASVRAAAAAAAKAAAQPTPPSRPQPKPGPAGTSTPSGTSTPHRKSRPTGES